MALKDIVPWRKQSSLGPSEYFQSFRDQMDRLFNEFWSDFPGPSSVMPRVESHLGRFVPHIEVSEDKERVSVTAELPGLGEQDIQLTLSANGDQLILKGEKKVEDERKEQNFYRSERVYGSFQRVIGLPARVDAEKVKASFKNGVLDVKMTKLPESASGIRQIQIGR